MKYDKNIAISKITASVKEYDVRLKGYQFLIYYQVNDHCEYKEIEFKASNFLHLTGVKSNLQPNLFYKKSMNGKLSVRDFEIQNNGNTQRKLEVISYLPHLLYNSCMIGDFNNNGISLRADYMVGDTRRTLCLGFGTSRQGCDYPASLIKGNVKDYAKFTGRVWAIFRRKTGEEHYTEIAFLNRKTDLDSLKLPEKVKITCTESA